MPHTFAYVIINVELWQYNKRNFLNIQKISFCLFCKVIWAFYPAGQKGETTVFSCKLLRSVQIWLEVLVHRKNLLLNKGPGNIPCCLENVTCYL